MPRITKVLLASLVLLGVCSAAHLASAQILVIGAPVCDGVTCDIQSYFQYWTTVSSNPAQYRRYGEFQITSIARNVPIDPPWQDGDWNIMAQPLSGYEDLLTNTEGKQNYNSLLELEVATDFPISSYFHEGEYISVFGWHSEDWGHSAVNPDHYANTTNGGKTELHPIIYIGSRSLFWPEFKVFAAQDASGRFPLANQSLDYYFGGWTIPLGQANPALAPLSAGSQVAVFPMEFLSESAVVDIGVATMGSNNQACWDQYHSVISADQTPGWVQITPRLGPFGGCLKQGYYGVFHRSEEQILRDSVRLWVDTLPDGHIVLDGIVYATLLTSSNHPPFVYTNWRYHMMTPNGAIIMSPTWENPNGNGVAYHIRYAPSLGLYQNTWWLYVIGNTKPPDWTPGAHRTANGLPPAEERQFAQIRVRHFVTPSSLTLDVKQLVSQLSLPPPPIPPGAPAPVASCVMSYDVSGVVQLVSTGVSPTPVNWRLVQTRSSVGQDIPNPTLVSVPGNGTTVTLDAVSASVTGTNQLHVAFQNAQSSGPAMLTAGIGMYFNNNAAIDVLADYSTSLGESPAAATHLSVSPCAAHYKSLAEAWEDFQKLIWIAEVLHEQGFGPTLPPTLTPALREGWRNMTFPLGDPQRWYNRLPPSARRLADTYRDMLSGRPVASAAAADLMRGLTLASGLPNPPRLRLPKLMTRKDFAGVGVKDTAFLASGPVLSKPGAQYRVRELEFDSAGTLTRRSVQMLLDWSHTLRNTGDRRIEITYTAPSVVGIVEARRRAAVIRQVLVNAGVGPAQIVTNGVVAAGAGSVPLELRVR
jgi:hypothetical protein